MTILLKNIFSLLRLLNSETGSKQVALGLSIGFILGFSPLLSIQGILLILCLIMFRIQVGAAFVSAFFFAFVAYLVDPLTHKLGLSILKLDALKVFFTELYNMPLIPFTQFNNSVVLGSGVLAFLMAPIMYFLFFNLIKQYRIRVVERLSQTKAWKLWKASSLFKWYATYDQYFK